MTDNNSIFAQMNLKSSLEQVRKHGQWLKYLPESDRNCKEIVLAAVAQNGDALEFASNVLKKDPDVLKTAVKENCYAIRFVGPGGCDDKEAVLIATKASGDTFQYASQRLRDDPEVLIRALAHRDDENVSALKYASPRLRNDSAMVLKAIAYDPQAIEYASAKMRDNSTIILAAVSSKCGGGFLEYASARLRADFHIVKTAIEHDGGGRAYTFASPELKARKDLLRLMIVNHETLKNSSVATFMAIPPELRQVITDEAPHYTFTKDNMGANLIKILDALIAKDIHAALKNQQPAADTQKQTTIKRSIRL